MAALVMTISLATVGFAAGNYKSIQAFFADIKVFNNGQRIVFDTKTQPFIVEGTTYVPVRALSDIFNKEVGWDGTTYTITLTDRPDPAVTDLWQQLLAGKNEIVELKVKIAALEKQLAEKEANEKYDIKDLQKDLNYDHGKYEKIDFDIYLTSKKNDKNIEVGISVDLDYDLSRWNSLSSKKLKDYLQDIVDDIQKEFKDADITGYIEDSSSSKYKELATFYLNTRGTLVVEEKSNSSSGNTTLSDLQRNLNNWWGSYERTNFEIKLYGDKYDVDVDIFVDDYDWNRMSTTTQKEYLQEIYDDIIYYFPDAYVEGEIYDDYYRDDELAYFYFSSSGTLTLR